MHPEMIRAIAVQQTRDWEADTESRGRARHARRARRAGRHSSSPDLIAGVRVPDYVDGTFHRKGWLSRRASSPRGAGSAAAAGTSGTGSPAPAPAPSGGRGVPASRDAA